jgi:hypothetical protein
VQRYVIRKNTVRKERKKGEKRRRKEDMDMLLFCYPSIGSIQQKRRASGDPSTPYCIRRESLLSYTYITLLKSRKLGQRISIRAQLQPNPNRRPPDTSL